MLIEINSAFAAMAADPPSCAAFVAEAVALARDSGFHGLHVACQFPACAVDIANFAFLISEWDATPRCRVPAQRYAAMHARFTYLPS